MRFNLKTNAIMSYHPWKIMPYWHFYKICTLNVLHCFSDIYEFVIL